MILSSLVRDDPLGHIDLDKNLGRHIGNKNVQAFHEEAGNLTTDLLFEEKDLVKILLQDGVIVTELSAALHNVKAEAFGLRTFDAKKDVQTFTPTLQSKMGKRDQSMERDIIQAQLVSNPAVNDRLMRNPAIMKVLTERVTKLYDSYKNKKS
ncbi:hypothetical protein JQ620_09255 [Bradyrhizobium sp. AUGA SZCCT0274]|uniref:hypothetical protein n=1 Tax=Bradyrhizobium sp. AUGA SZCCT0274 TaxID=2807670 RepID=UPI001BA8FD6D|nr:hypothetical protein [Bradyrhizobium sp. AUGA SZCCT0274]MBR1240311.1 hypothetical protein [Bradyrhizobium sp. AUGA SZCCT0274]